MSTSIPEIKEKIRRWVENRKVVLQITHIAIKGNLLAQNDIVIAAAGDNAALALKINSIKPPQTALLDIIFRSDIQLA
ncbi:MAG: hypothetical protein A3G91_03775 [Omnitrophica WOR_2 bacterium RIFCSPLOWO2_12_FULL_50_9]|nr:MAG: hypothetical protein A3D87_04345 [Omnitrophica WOR_2 bacterium RIFCSPHIGHO2_02_FULL_50_17]OGX40228.1 MAG: hypothetical protein A3G91_03775 [Omnitrophica WOR_2 bacterium RIFCSPLOWO2_12_FULL_50_9]